MGGTRASINFAFLAQHDARLHALASQAEEHFAADPTVTLFKLRQLGEVLAQRAAAMVGLYDPYLSQHELINRLADRGVIASTQRALFHDLRKVGNAAVHEGRGDHREALHQLRMARELAVWFARSFGKDKKLSPGPFVPPPDPKKADAALHLELERLRADMQARKAELDAAQRAIEDAQRAAELEAKQRLTAEERASKAAEEAAIWEALAQQEIDVHREAARKHEDAAKAEAKRSAELAEQNAKLLAELAQLQANASHQPAKEIAKTITDAAEASEALELDEAATRKLIDKQLSDAGWEDLLVGDLSSRYPADPIRRSPEIVDRRSPATGKTGAGDTLHALTGTEGICAHVVPADRVDTVDSDAPTRSERTDDQVVQRPKATQLGAPAGLPRGRGADSLPAMFSAAAPNVFGRPRRKDGDTIPHRVPHARNEAGTPEGVLSSDGRSSTG